MLGEYIVAHPLSVDCIVDDAVLDCLDPPSELLLLLLLEVSNIPTQISLTFIYGWCLVGEPAEIVALLIGVDLGRSSKDLTDCVGDKSLVEDDEIGR